MIDAGVRERALRAVRGVPTPRPAVEKPVAGDLDGRITAVLIAVALSRRFEGLFLRPYLCPASVPTIGYGATYYESGARVTLADPPITRERAEQLLVWMVRTKYLPAVIRLCPALVAESPERLAAIIDFTFNLGAGRLSASTLRKRINAGRWGDVPAELMKWVMGGGKKLRGLVLRRGAECALV